MILPLLSKPKKVKRPFWNIGIDTKRRKQFIEYHWHCRELYYFHGPDYKVPSFEEYLEKTSKLKQQQQMEKLQLIQQKNLEWRWRFVVNGRIIATSGGDGYKKWQDCYASWTTTRNIPKGFNWWGKKEVCPRPEKLSLAKKIATKLGATIVDHTKIKPALR